MKKYTSYILMIVLFSFFAAQVLGSALSGTNVSAPIKPFDSSDTYPTHDARYGKGGYVQWATTSARNAIPAFRRYSGMVVYTVDTDTEYRWSGTAWVPKSNGSGHTIQTSTGVNLPQRSVFRCMSGAKCADVNGQTRLTVPEATTSVSGLMSASDKVTLNNSFKVSIHPYTSPIIKSTDRHRLDPSQIIKVGSTYYVYYTKCAVTASYVTGTVITGGEIAVASAPSLLGPWTEQPSVILKGAPGAWDAAGVYTPEILVKNGTYYLFYNGTTVESDTIPDGTGVATANSPLGPFTKSASNPILTTGASGAWDDVRANGPGPLEMPDGSWRLYYKGRSVAAPNARKFGFATCTAANFPNGPWTKYAGNPIFGMGVNGSNNVQYEDPNPIIINGRYYLLCNQMVTANEDLEVWESADGIAGWTKSPRFDPVTGVDMGLVTWAGGRHLGYGWGNDNGVVHAITFGAIAATDPDTEKHGIGLLLFNPLSPTTTDKQFESVVSSVGSFVANNGLPVSIDPINKRIGINRSNPRAIISAVYSGDDFAALHAESESTAKGCKLFLDTYNNTSFPGFNTRRALGTMASPLSVTSGAILYNAVGHGWNEARGFNPSDPVAKFYSGGSLSLVAGSDWSLTSQETRLDVLLTPSGSVASSVALSVQGNGNLTPAGDIVLAAGKKYYGDGSSLTGILKFNYKRTTDLSTTNNNFVTDTDLNGVVIVSPYLNNATFSLGSTMGAVGDTMLVFNSHATNTMQFTGTATIDGSTAKTLAPQTYMWISCTAPGVWMTTSKSATGSDHHLLTNLTANDDHTQYALLAGRATPQTIAFGNNASASTGYLTSTSHATKGSYALNAAGTIVVDELNARIGHGTATPQSQWHLTDPAASASRGIMLAEHGTGNVGQNFIFRKSQGGSEASPTAVVSGNGMGNIYWGGYAGATGGYAIRAGIQAQVNGTVVDGATPTIPSDLVFLVGTTGVAESLRIPSDGGFRLASATAPTCDAAHRGTFFYVAGASLVKDNVQVCGKDSADVYAWRTIY